MKKIFIGVVVLVALAGIAFKAKGLMTQRKQEIVNEPLPQKRSINVQTTQATHGSMKSTQSHLATVAANKSIKVATKMAGYIQKIYVDESQWVEKRAMLARIDERDIDANIDLLRTTLAQQRNDLALAQQIYVRNQKLYDVGGLAKEQLDTSLVILEGKRSALKATKQKIAQLKDQKSYLVIQAPFSGEIDTLLMHEGDLAVAGKPILSMSSGSKKLLFSFVPSKEDIRVGQMVYREGELIGKISKILTLAKQGLVQAEVALGRNLGLPLGATINVEVVTQQQEGCIVSNDTLLHKREGTFVMRYLEGKFVASKVEILMSEPNRSMIHPCPTAPIAKGSEVLLAKLPLYGEVSVQKVQP